jgi:hypothetical protein
MYHHILIIYFILFRFNLLKSKTLNESTKSVDLIEQIAHVEVRYSDALNEINEKDKMYSQLFTKIKQNELKNEQQMYDLNLKQEQDKYINQLLNQKNSKTTKSTTKIAKK